MGFDPTWLRQVSPLLHMTTLTTALKGNLWKLMEQEYTVMSAETWSLILPVYIINFVYVCTARVRCYCLHHIIPTHIAGSV